MTKNSVIIIDDDADICNAMSDYFEMMEIPILGIASNGKDGLELLEKINPDKILLDIMMPQYDGVYFLENASKEILSKVIIHSGDVSSETHEKLKNYSSCKFLDKPTDLEKLLTIINEK